MQIDGSDGNDDGVADIRVLREDVVAEMIAEKDVGFSLGAEGVRFATGERRKFRSCLTALAPKRLRRAWLPERDRRRGG